MNQTRSGLRGRMKFSVGNLDPKEAVEKIVGSIGKLSRLDVYRVLDANREDATEIADFIKEERPDLVGEVRHIMNIYGSSWN